MKLLTAVFLLAVPAVWAADPQPAKPDAHTVALFRFDKDEGDAFASAAGKGGKVERNVDAKWTAEGRFGGGLQFPERAATTKPTSVTLAEGGIEPTGLTVDFWFKVDSSSPIIGNDFYLVSNGYLYFRFSVERQSLEFGLSLPAGWVGCGSTRDKTALAPGKWMHMAGTYDGSELRLYLDGQRVAVTPGKGPLTQRDTFTLGSCAWKTDEALFQGVIDELRFSNVARTEF
jgi:hypothetical protein